MIHELLLLRAFWKIGENDCLLGYTESNVSKILMYKEKECQGRGQ